jgi:imidazolonepropionase-like amidohydrolase
VIVASTRTNASILGWEKTIGVLQSGKVADLIVVAGDPLKDIGRLRQVELVVKDGVVVHSKIPEIVLPGD